MNRFPALFVGLLACALSLAAADPAPPKIKPSAPIKEFRLPTFDKQGNRAAFLRAGEATFVTREHIDVKDMHLTLFTKDGSGAFDTVLLAPYASFLTEKKYVSGKDSVRLIRLDVEVTGEQWSYDHVQQRILIGKNARVTFLDQLKDIIK